MEIETGRLPKDEQVPLLLRGLFEQRGYRRYRMSNFEAYDLYRENKNFLESEGIITFTDASGRLMALKPDVTMSIVKHTKPDAVSSSCISGKRVRSGAAERRIPEISQMGLEFIGGQGGYAEAEAVELAVRSLAAIGPQSVLDVGHMGFITSLLDVLGVREEARAAALDALRAKNAHTLRAIAAESGCTEEEAGQLAALAALAGPFPETLDAARALVAAPGMADACGELQSLYDALEAVDAADTLRLDFSTLNDIDYYNGVVFKGYVRGVPRAVLAGGRYDNLMRRFGKPQPAVGFALYLGGLGRAFAEKSDYDVDTLLLYDAGQSPAQVARAVQSILKSGRSVRAEQSAPEGLRVRQTLRLGPDGAVPVTGGGGIC
ncbi:ATP phosphoribosyltransferase regulatory subunit [Ruthenibacterium lactatiformans]|uniref:ATP phosphoribosyltransferase regulatory subunit n=1 Tax=Ruthenibacterium lactatiformans TaxID=1550024 RepID=UPI0039A1FC45